MSDDNTKTPPRDSAGNGRDDTGTDAVSAAYRRASGDVPSADLDTAVLAMAHREVNGIHVATPRPRWFVPVAVAATVVVAVSLGLQVSRTPHESVAMISGDDSHSPAPDEARSPRAHAPAVAPSPSPVGIGAYLDASPAARADKSASAMMQERGIARQYSRVKEGNRSGAEAVDEATAHSSAQALAVNLVREAVTRARDEAREPAEWLEIIKALDTAGERLEARIEWHAFRTVYPDEPLPPGFPEFE